MNIMLYHVIYSIQYYLLFHITVVGLGTYYPQIWGSAYIFFCNICSHLLNYIVSLPRRLTHKYRLPWKPHI